MATIRQKVFHTAQNERTETAKMKGARGISQIWNWAMLPTLYVRVQAISSRFRGRVSEWHLALVMLLCGIVLLWPGDTFQLAPYVYMRGIASEVMFGWLFVVLGVARMTVLGINGAMRRGAPHLRAAAALISICVWSALLAGYATLGVPTVAAALLIGAIVADCFNGYRAAAAARVEDDRQR